ncbi:MAG: hypothetical protein ACK4XH_10520 [Microcystis sp.]|jgi:hypothetical protein|uniref:hypothetical protein n=1 Tax=Microcystis sp. TaxID=1127 RepID=UPI00391D680D
MTTWKILGRVIDRQTRSGISGLRVEAWDKDLIYDDLLGSAVTGEGGDFQIMFDESYFREVFLDRRPDIFFKIFQDNELIESTEDSVLWNIESGENQMVIEADQSISHRHKLGLSGPIRVTLPVEVAYNLEALQVSIAEIMGRVGCKPCFSGAACTFLHEREFILDPVRKVTPLNRPIPELMDRDLGARAGGVSVVLDAGISNDIERVKEAIARIVARLGCPACHSGFDIAFRNELDLITVDKKLNVQAFGKI